MTAWLTCPSSRCRRGLRIAYCQSAARKTVAAILPELATATPAAVPLWKVSSAPPRRRTKPGPKGPGFFLGEWRVANSGATIRNSLLVIRLSSHENLHPRRLFRHAAHATLLSQARRPRRHRVDRSYAGRRRAHRAAARRRSPGAVPRTHADPRAAHRAPA